MIFTTYTLACYLRSNGVPVEMRAVFAHQVAHDLDREQLAKLKDALGDCSDWPKHTDDPRVNYAVDCLVSFDEKPPTFDEIGCLYVKEIKAAKKAGLDFDT